MLTRFRPHSTPGQICLASLGAIALFGAILGLILTVESLFGCDINGGDAPCLILGLNWNGLLTSLALFGGFGVFLLSPILFLTALVAGTVCAVRRRW
jgi:hypothetical protein